MSSVATRACSCPCTRSPQQGTVVRPISVRVPSQRSSHQTLRVLRLGLLSRHHAGLAALNRGSRLVSVANEPLKTQMLQISVAAPRRCPSAHCGPLPESSLAVSDLSCRRKENGGWEMLGGNRANPLATFAPNPRSLVCPKTLLDCLDLANVPPKLQRSCQPSFHNVYRQENQRRPPQQTNFVDNARAFATFDWKLKGTVRNSRTFAMEAPVPLSNWSTRECWLRKALKWIIICSGFFTAACSAQFCEKRHAPDRGLKSPTTISLPDRQSCTSRTKQSRDVFHRCEKKLQA